MPPRDLPARLRWIILLMNMGVVAGEAAQISLQPARTMLWPWPVLALGALAFLQVRSYRNGGGRTYYAETLIQCCLVGFAMLGGTDPRVGLWLLYIPLELRSLYGGWRHVIVATVAMTFAFLGMLALWPTVHVDSVPIATTEIADWIVGFVFTGGSIHLIWRMAASHERGGARERSLARAGRALVGALDRAQVERAALEAVRDLLAGCEITLVALALKEADGTSIVVAAEGEHADFLRGKRIMPTAVPDDVQRRVQLPQVVLDRAATEGLRQSLGLPYTPGVVTLTQMHIKGRQIGTLVVESPRRLPNETADGLTTIALETALAIESARLTEHLQDLAYRDQLTGLANRARFLERMDQAVERARSRGIRLAVLFLDLDDFKVINDSLGHAAGDRLLCTVAQRLRGCIQSSGLIARLGGDEFTILLEDTSSDRVEDLARQLAAELCQPVELDGRRLIVGASVGVALCEPGGAINVDVQDLLRAADLALYAAKARGKGQSATFEPAMAVRVFDRLERARAARAA